MTHATIRAWRLVHKWTSLVCTAFLLMLCLTGLPLIFSAEIDAAIGGRVVLPAVAPGLRAPSLDALLSQALAVEPGAVPLYVSLDADRPVVNVTTGPRADAPEAEMHFQSRDRRTGLLLPAAGGGITDLLLRIHKDMFLGLPGMLFLGAMGLAFVAAIVSGVVLYAPFTRKLRFGEIRRQRGRRVRWLDRHNLLGIVTVAWAVTVGITGTLNTLVDPITALWKADRLAAMSTAHHGDPISRRASSLQAAIDAAMRRAPDMRVQFVAFPGTAYSSKDHYGVYLAGATPLTARLLEPVFVDARSGRIASAEPMPWYMKALLLARPLHFGDYGGLPLKLLWALLDIVTIVVLASGLYLWWSHRRERGEPAAAPVVDPVRP